MKTTGQYLAEALVAYKKEFKTKPQFPIGKFIADNLDAQFAAEKKPNRTAELMKSFDKTINDAIDGYRKLLLDQKYNDERKDTCIFYGAKTLGAGCAMLLTPAAISLFCFLTSYVTRIAVITYIPSFILTTATMMPVLAVPVIAVGLVTLGIGAGFAFMASRCEGQLTDTESKVQSHAYTFAL